MGVMRKISSKPVDVQSQEFTEYKNNKARAVRKALITRLVSQIETGEFSNIKEDPNRLYPQFSAVRKEYKNPVEQGGREYTGMEVSEIGAGTPNTW